MSLLSVLALVLVAPALTGLLIGVHLWRHGRSSTLVSGVLSLTALGCLASVLCMLFLHKIDQLESERAAWQTSVAPLVESRLPKEAIEVSQITPEDVEHALDPCYVRDWRERALASSPACVDQQDDAVAVNISSRF